MTNASGSISQIFTYDGAGCPLYLHQNGTLYQYHYNGHGDVIKLTDMTGAVKAEYKYDAWGNITSQTGMLANSNPYRCAGYWYDEETKLYHLNARYYKPDVGRFISQDGFGGFKKDPLSLNRYAYSRNNPVKFIDPSGKFFLETAIGLSVGAVAGAFVAAAAVVAVAAVTIVAAVMIADAIMSESNTVRATDVTALPPFAGGNAGDIADWLGNDGYVNYPPNPGSVASDVWYDPGTGSQIRIDPKGHETAAPGSIGSTPHIHKGRVEPGATSRTKARNKGKDKFDDNGNPSGDYGKTHIPINGLVSPPR